MVFQTDYDEIKL